jgi:hypothetical protein
VSSDPFVERQYKSQRGRYMAGMRRELESLQREIQHALQEMDSGECPSSSLVPKVVAFDRYQSALQAMEELRAAYETIPDAQDASR